MCTHPLDSGVRPGRGRGEQHLPSLRGRPIRRALKEPDHHYTDNAGRGVCAEPALFPGGPGKTWSRDDFVSLIDDLEERVFGPLPDETWVYPGHGDDTTLEPSARRFGSDAPEAGDRSAGEVDESALRSRDEGAHVDLAAGLHGGRRLLRY